VVIDGCGVGFLLVTATPLWLVGKLDGGGDDMAAV